MKNLRRLACKIDLDQSVRKSSQVSASARKPWPNGVVSRSKFSTWVYLRVRLARAVNHPRAFSTSFSIRRVAGDCLMHDSICVHMLAVWPYVNDLKLYCRLFCNTG